jgi:hypothetical protein
MKKLFYNFKDKKFIVKDLNFDMHNKEAWISFEEKPSRKEDCYFLGEMSLQDCGKFHGFVLDKERIGVRDESLPELPVLLKYFKEWQKPDH